VKLLDQDLTNAADDMVELLMNHDFCLSFFPLPQLVTWQIFSINYSLNTTISPFLLGMML
jgi:hypothetical protein